MAADLEERRRHERLRSEQTTWTHARLRTGDALFLLDIGAGGAQVESTRRLLPGATVVVQFASGDAAVSVRARVVRCSVCALSAQDGIRYRGALAFVEEGPSVRSGGPAPGESREQTGMRSRDGSDARHGRPAASEHPAMSGAIAGAPAASG